MTKAIKLVGLIMFTLVGNTIIAQTNKEKAFEKAKEAIELMDNGKIEESIRLLKESQKLDPDRFDFPYEIAFAHYLKKDYKQVIKILEKNANHKDVNERLFQLLGNSYDLLGKTDEAFYAYDQGLKKFPNSGMIHLEKGNVYWGKNDFDKAISFYEKGIEVDPKFPSNYYRAALIYCNSKQEVWGLIYGEIFMNLERNSKRTAEISKLLYDTYKSQITIVSDTCMKVSFCQQMTLNIDDLSNFKEFKLPFCMIYEPTFLLSMNFIKELNINTLSDARSNFVDNYFKLEHHKTHPNVLFDYQKKMLDLGHLEAYNHWILMKGNEDAFGQWHEVNKEKWEAFIEWYTKNKLVLDDTNKFYSGQY